MKNDIYVYVHIPFCVRKCLYCDFPSVCYDKDQAKAYLASLISEIEASDDILSKRNIKTVYFGGGTPSVVPSSHIEKIIKTLKKIAEFDPNAEISLEMNPGTADEEKIDAYLKLGINRFSLGMQSLNEKELKALGRIHDRDAVFEAFRLLRRLGAQNINLDIMTGIPYQDTRSLKKTFDEVFSLKPDHISAYTLILEPNTPFYEMGRKKLSLCDEDEEMRMYEFTVKYLEENGYERYEISNYASGKKQCLHNLAYWDCLDYAGFGLSAASRLKNRRFANTRNLKDYIKDPVNNRAEDLLLTKAEEMSEYIFMGMRKTSGISEKSFRERFRADIHDVYGQVLEKYIKQGLIIAENDHIRFSPRGLDVSNIILSEFV